MALDQRDRAWSVSSGPGGGYEGAVMGRDKYLGVAGYTPGWQCRACECSQRLPVKPARQMHT